MIKLENKGKKNVLSQVAFFAVQSYLISYLSDNIDKSDSMATPTLT